MMHHGAKGWRLPASRKPRRKRIGQVSYYIHHGARWIYYLDGQRQIRRRVGADEASAEQTAALVNAQLAAAAPTMFSFSPVTVAELCREFLDYHENVMRSAPASIKRYRAALKYLQSFAARGGG